MLFLEASVIFVWRPQVLECLYLICHLSPLILTRSCFQLDQLLHGRVVGQGVMLTLCLGMAERVRGGGGGGDHPLHGQRDPLLFGSHQRPPGDCHRISPAQWDLKPARLPHAALCKCIIVSRPIYLCWGCCHK